MERISVNRFSFRRKGSTKRRNENKETEFDVSQLTHISQDQAQKIEEELLTEYGFSIEQLLELSGYSCAVAIAKCYPVDKMTKDNGAVLVCCGPGSNGGNGLVTARHLKMFGYKPSIFYPFRSNKAVFQSLVKQCEGIGMPFLSFLPSEPNLISDSYNLVVDALIGYSFNDPPKTDFASSLDTLKNLEVPIISIDVPSGWDIQKGCENGLKPELLISLTAPKDYAKLFQGKTHYLGGRYVPNSLAQKYELNLPPFPGTDCVVEIKSNSENGSDT